MQHIPESGNSHLCCDWHLPVLWQRRLLLLLLLLQPNSQAPSTQHTACLVHSQQSCQGHNTPHTRMQTITWDPCHPQMVTSDATPHKLLQHGPQ
jgi:hypothetical protein